MNNLERIGNELKLAGFKLEPITELKTPQDYSQMIGNSVYAICELVSKQGHSGSSLQFLLNMLKILLIEGKPLSGLTNNSNEWKDISEEAGKTLYQSKRDFSCFSEDLIYYYDLDNTDTDGTYIYKKLKEVQA